MVRVSVPVAALLLAWASGAARAACGDDPDGDWSAVRCFDRDEFVETVEVDLGSIERRGPWVLYDERRRYLRRSDGQEATDAATGAALDCLTLARGSTRYMEADPDTGEPSERTFTLDQVEQGARRSRSIGRHWERLCSCPAAADPPARAASADETTLRAIHDRYVAPRTVAASYGVNFVTTSDPDVAALIERDLARGVPFTDVADEYNHPVQPKGGTLGPAAGSEAAGGRPRRAAARPFRLRTAAGAAPPRYGVTIPYSTRSSRVMSYMPSKGAASRVK